MTARSDGRDAGQTITLFNMSMVWYTSSGNHYSGEDFTSKLKSVNRLLFYLTTLIRHHVYSILVPGKTYGFQRKSLYYFAFNFQWSTLAIFREDNDGRSQLSTTMSASEPLNHPSFNKNPLEDYNDILEQVSVGITRGSTSVTSFKTDDRGQATIWQQSLLKAWTNLSFFN